MIEIRELAPGQLAEAADFAAQQFGCDISAAQPKLYGPRAARQHLWGFYTGQNGGYAVCVWDDLSQPAMAQRGFGMLRAPVPGTWGDARIVQFLEREVYPQYDAVSLLGQLQTL